MMLMTMATDDDDDDDDYDDDGDDDDDDDDDGASPLPILGPLSEGRWTRHARKKLVLSKVAVTLRDHGSGHLKGNCS